MDCTGLQDMGIPPVRTNCWLDKPQIRMSTTNSTLYVLKERLFFKVTILEIILTSINITHLRVTLTFKCFQIIVLFPRGRQNAKTP